MKKYGFFFLMAFISCGLAAQNSDPEHIVGIWKTPGNELLIKIDKIGNSFQGRIVWLKSTLENDGSLDVNNPNEHLRNMPLKGSKIIEELIYDEQTNCWEGGTYYNFKEGKLYNCQISLIKENQISVSKFIQLDQDVTAETWIRQ